MLSTRSDTTRNMIGSIATKIRGGTVWKEQNVHVRDHWDDDRGDKHILAHVSNASLWAFCIFHSSRCSPRRLVQGGIGEYSEQWTRTWMFLHLLIILLAFLSSSRIDWIGEIVTAFHDLFDCMDEHKALALAPPAPSVEAAAATATNKESSCSRSTDLTDQIILC